MKTCKYCGGNYSATHYCSTVGRNVDYDSVGDFLFSAAIGAMTDNFLLGGLLGGDMLGGIVGDIFSDGDLF